MNQYIKENYFQNFSNVQKCIAFYILCYKVYKYEKDRNTKKGPQIEADIRTCI